MTDLMAQAIAERGELLELVESLTPAQWRHPTLCTEWNVQQVVTHVVGYDHLTPGAVLVTMLRAGLSLARANAARVAAGADLTPVELVELVRRSRVPRGLTAQFGGAIALTDGIIHAQDIRRPLGLPRAIPPDRLIPALEFALRAPTLPSRRRLRGVRLVATDLDWAHGAGPELRGTGEALLLTVAGRSAVWSELAGEGADRVRDGRG